VLDLRSLGLLHCARASPAASPTRFAIFKGVPGSFKSEPARVAPRATVYAVSFLFFSFFPCIFGFSFVFWACFSAAVGSGLGVYWVLGRVCSGFLGAFFVFLGLLL
jgi:hypothetical protein